MDLGTIAINVKADFFGADHAQFAKVGSISGCLHSLF